jgi:hypothetical protein
MMHVAEGTRGQKVRRMGGGGNRDEHAIGHSFVLLHFVEADIDA